MSEAGEEGDDCVWAGDAGDYLGGLFGWGFGVCCNYGVDIVIGPGLGWCDEEWVVGPVDSGTVERIGHGASPIGRVDVNSWSVSRPWALCGSMEAANSARCCIPMGLSRFELIVTVRL